MISANILLYGIFSICVWLGIKLASQKTDAKNVMFADAFYTTVISFLPIAVAYHSSHYLVPLLVNHQYLFLALSDPFSMAGNSLGLNNYRVTTGFLNTQDSVERIWLSQAAIIVLGHILVVLIAHNACEKLYDNKRQALLFHVPLAIFRGFLYMVWALVTGIPKGA